MLYAINCNSDNTIRKYISRLGNRFQGHTTSVCVGKKKEIWKNSLHMLRVYKKCVEELISLFAFFVSQSV